MTPFDFFEKTFKSKVEADPACMKSSGVKGKKIALNIEGGDGGQWTFNFDAEGNLQMESGNAASDAECLVTMKDKTFDGMLRGKVNVPMAFVTRKIKVKGEQSLAAKLGIALQKSFS